MPYLTQTEIQTAIGEGELLDLADRDGDGFADAAVVAQAIDRAGSIIDSYLRSRFALPLAETPDLVRECALHIARYLLSEDHATDRVTEDYKQALKWLSEIRAGQLDLGLTPADEAAKPDSPGPAVSGGRPAFDRDALDRWSGTRE